MTAVDRRCHVLSYFSMDRVSCECDMEFRSCLRRLGSVHSETVEKLFFRVFQVKCIAETRQCVDRFGLALKMSPELGCHPPNRLQSFYTWAEQDAANFKYDNQF